MSDPVNPNHYRFPGGIELNSITKHLTGNGAQAVQYVARATRLDGSNKGDLVEDLKKAQWFIESEIQRISGAGVEVSRTPRVWQTLREVPNVEVKDIVGDHWLMRDGTWHYDARGNQVWEVALTDDINHSWGPFTEVLK